MALIATRIGFEREECILFEDISIAVTAGQILRIRGENGAGKTTLIKILSGLLSPSYGSVTWNGVPLAQCRSHFHQQLCYIGHNSAVNLQLSPQENLSFAAKAYDTRMTVSAALQRLGMAAYATVLAANLSAGQRRRVALAKLCLIRAQLWLLDEPYTAQDSHGIAIINDLITKHLHQGGSVVITSHQAIDLPSITLSELTLA